MTTLELSLDFQPQKKLLITNNPNISLELDYNGDIDFTGFVEMLLFKIDENILFQLIDINEESLDKKELIIYQTIKEIINSYNISFKNEEGE